ncbi:hypothetical protein EPI10_033441 [Gossypium australe]|uniref:Uncharacterized protein n=1 Tax=Gossypium australe TaxID=47621 RepID=A0A5B6X867_9ROSI|nr:hypothetical protein EPI10_033441 [Gossypium australe]
MIFSNRNVTFGTVMTWRVMGGWNWLLSEPLFGSKSGLLGNFQEKTISFYIYFSTSVNLSFGLYLGLGFAFQQ